VKAFGRFWIKFQCFFSVSAVNFTEVFGTEVLYAAVLGRKNFLVRQMTFHDFG
jgi:hypothetical protein